MNKYRSFDTSEIFNTYELYGIENSLTSLTMRLKNFIDGISYNQNLSEKKADLIIYDVKSTFYFNEP